MKSKFLLLSTALTIAMTLLTYQYASAQINFEGLAANHEGVAAWNADGSGPEPAAFAHMHPFGWGSSRYYAASRDYDDIDPNPEAALAHLLDDMNGFPLFQQALADNGFSPGQVKIKIGLNNAQNDMEGEDWFTFDGKHYFNKYDGTYTLELIGEGMISGYFSFAMCSYDSAIYNSWQMETNYTDPLDASSGSSAPVQAVAAAFLQDMNGDQLRVIYENMESTSTFFNGNGRPDGVFFNVSGYLEKGHPELPFNGLEAHHQGIAAWDADGTGPEPAGQGHTVTYNGTDYFTTYYFASVDYDDIDTNASAALCQSLEAGSGFPNLEIQLAYRGYTFDQLKVKSGISILGNDEEGIDWGLDGSIHWWRNYGNHVTIEIAGEPILEYMIDTNYTMMYLEHPSLLWSSDASFSPVKDISGSASPDAQFVALSLLKDMGGQFVSTYMEGHGLNFFSGNGRTGVFHQVDNGYLTLGTRDYGTTVDPGAVSGTWNAQGSPYMIEGSLEVPDGETLSIGEGVRLAFRGPFNVTVNGRIDAQGSEDAKIVFTHSNPAVSWDGLDYPDTPGTNDSSFFNYCLFQHGYAQGEEPFNSGGAIALVNFDKFKLTNCTFQHNRADQPGANYEPAGGAIALWNSDAVMQNCIFRYNYAEVAAGAVFAYENSKPIISGCLFYDNRTPWWAGAIGYYQESGGILLNSTVVDNDAELGGALAFYDNSSPKIINTILWNNTAMTEGNEVYINHNTCTPGFYYCDIEGGSEGFGGELFTGEYMFNIKEDPLFNVPPDLPVYSLYCDSPCIDAGTPDTSAWFYPEYLLPTCLCSNPRVFGAGIEMGCYEIICVGINEPGYNDEIIFTVYPNPVNSQAIIEIHLAVEASFTMSIMDLSGKVIYEEHAQTLPSGNHQLTWNAESAAPGLYFCRLQSGGKSTVKKIVVL